MFNDAIDDQPHSAIAAGFVGMDCNTNPQLLEPGMLADGKNMYCRGDGAVESRPGLKVACTSVVSLLNYYGAAACSLPITTLGYFDVPGYEAAIYYSTNWFWAITSGADNATPVRIETAGIYSNPATGSPLVQMLDTFFYLDTFGRINWLTYTAGVWTNGTVTTFSSAATMPVWARLVTQGFRLIAIETSGYKLYASAIGAATVAANWVSTENIQVGNGEGDPAKAVLATQGDALTVLNGHSAYQINQSAASVANWSSIQVCRHTGCIEGRTAVVVGQDVLFLARFGVVSLGALSDTMSISAQAALSAPIQPYIDRINWAQISNAFAVPWRNCYLIALPLDSENEPTHVFAYDLTLRRWMPPWVYTAAPFTYPGTGGQATFGLRCSVVTHFADKTETLIGDAFGQILRIDETPTADQTTASIAAVAPFAPTFSDTAIPCYLRTRSMNHDTTAAKKQALMLEWELAAFASSTDVAVVVLVDDAATVTTAPDSNTVGHIGGFTLASSGNVTRRNQLRGAFYNRTLAPYYSAAIELFCAAKKIRVRSLKLSAFHDAPHYSS